MNELKRHPSLLPNAAEIGRLRQELAALNPPRAARIITAAHAADRVFLFRCLPTALAGEVFYTLSPEQRSELVNNLVDHIRVHAHASEPDSETPRGEALDEMPGCVVRRLLETIPDEAREALFRFAAYPETAIARDMNAGFIALRPDFTIEQSLDQIRRYGAGSRAIDRLLVVDDDWRPLGSIGIRELLLANPQQRIRGLDIRPTPVLRASDDREEVAARFPEAGPAPLPVTDPEGALAGVVCPDDIREIERNEATEDFQKFGGSEELDLSYTRTPLLSLVKKRAGWLVVLFLSEMLTASAMGYFDDEIARAVVLALFVPLIISSGGNSGSQAASLIIRALALGELPLRKTWYVLRKELLSGVLLGAILGTIGFIRILIWQECGIYDYGEFWLWIATSVAVSLLFIVLWGTIAGAMIPLLLKRIGLDPATASAPFVATLADVTGLIIYFSVAALFLSGKLL